MFLKEIMINVYRDLTLSLLKNFNKNENMKLVRNNIIYAYTMT